MRIFDTNRRWAAMLLTPVLLIVAATTHAADSQALQRTLVAYLEDQTLQMSGEVHVDVTMPRIALTECRAPEPFLPGRNPRVIGNITVGVRCPGDRPSTRYFQARVSVVTAYYVAARTLSPGDILSAADITRETGDISRLSAHVVTRPDALIGKASVRRIAPGMPLSENMVKQPTAIERGDRVRIIARGAGFSITTEGKALNAAPIGGNVRVSTRNGSIVTGTSTDSHTVTVRQ